MPISGTVPAEDYRVYGLLATGLFINRPLPGIVDRFYFSTDTLILERDTGTNWVEVVRGETAIRLAQLVERAHGSLTGITPDQHHAQDHSISHESGGGDEINVAGLLGLLADDQHVIDAEVLAVAAALLHSVTHEPGGADAMAVDAIAGTGSLRTLGAGAQQAMPGNAAPIPGAHKDTHDPEDGADALDTAIPVTVGAANAEGISHSLARADHVHEREHARYADAEADARIAIHTADDDAHHSVFTPADHTAIGDAAPHHARYTDAEAGVVADGKVATHSNLNEGIHGIVSNSVSIGVTGWYRIASTSSRASAEFSLHELTQHSNISFKIGMSSGRYVDYGFTLLNSSVYRTAISRIQKVRIVYKDYTVPFYIEVYVVASVTCQYFMYKNDADSGFTAVDWTAGSVPGGYTTVEFDILDKMFMVATADKRFSISRTGEVDVGSVKITSLANPVANTDADNKGQRDAAIATHTADDDAHHAKATFTELFSSGNFVSTTNTWEDWDLSAIIGAGAKSALVFVRCAYGGNVGARKNGSAINRYINVAAGAGYNDIFVLLTEVDASRILEIYAPSTSQIAFYIIGYWS